MGYFCLFVKYFNNNKMLLNSLNSYIFYFFLETIHKYARIQRDLVEKIHVYYKEKKITFIPGTIILAF